MKFTLLSSLAAAALTTIVPQVSAFPALANLSPERMAELSQMARDFEAPNYVQKRASTVGKVTVGTKKLPDEDHPFQAPGEGDLRGPCPGNNLMANHGYIPRNGIAHFDELVYGQMEAIGMGLDLATFLATIMVVVNGNPLTGMVSIAGKDKRVGSFLGRQIPGGLGEHNKYEIDHSLTRNDAYFGEYWKLNGTLYEEMFKVADEVSGLGAGKGVVTPHSLAIYRNNRYKESVATNPDFTFAPLGVLFFGADQFVWRSHVSADSNGKLLPATRENVASFYGAKDTGNGTWEYVPERFADDWYRPAVPLTIAELVAEGAGSVLYAATHGPALPIGITAASVKSPRGFACALYQTVYGGIPAFIESIDLVKYLDDHLFGMFDQYHC